MPLPADLGPGAFVRNAQHDGDLQVNVASGTLRGIANRTKEMRDPLMQMLQAAAASGTLAGAPPPFSIRNVHGLAYSFVPQGAYDISFKPGSFTQPGYCIAGNMLELQEALGTCQKYGLSINDDGKLLVPAGGVMCEMGLHGDGREGVAAKAIGCIGLPPGAFAGLRLDVALVGDAGERVGDIMQFVVAKAAGQCLFAKMDCLAGDVPIASLEVGVGEGAKKYKLVAKAHGPVHGAYARGRAARSGGGGGGGRGDPPRGERPPTAPSHPPPPSTALPPPALQRSIMWACWACRRESCGRALRAWRARRPAWACCARARLWTQAHRTCGASATRTT